MEFLTAHFDTILTVLVTIIGFVVTILITRSSFKKEIRKNKISLTTQEIISLPLELCKFINNLEVSQEGVEQYMDLLSKVIAYGSRDAVKISVKMQQLAYKKQKDEDISLDTMAAVSLLITQIKYDLTSEIISPDSWPQMRFHDYDKINYELKNKINDIVDELGLMKKLKIQ